MATTIHEFIITKKTYQYSHCSHCDGKGILERTFRKTVYVQDCPVCDNGRVRFTQIEEFPLIDALKTLQLLK